MTILFYCEEYPPYRNGGIGTVVKLVAEHLAVWGHSVIVAGKYPGNDKTVAVDVQNGVTVYRFHSGAYRTLKKSFLNAMSGIVGLIKNDKIRKEIEFQKAKIDYRKTEDLLAKLIREHKIELMELPDYVDDFLHGLSRTIRFRKFDVPVNIRVHGAVSFLEYYRNGKVRQEILELDKAHFERADRICAVSEFSKQFVNEQIKTTQNVDVIYNPIEASLFELPKENEKSNAILFFGKIVETKGAFSLIKAFNKIGDSYPQIRLKLIGSGEVEKAVDLIKNSLKDRVEFVGFQPKSAVIEEIDKSLFCVLPSYFETLSMSALEVFSRRKALIFTERASGRELISDGENGFLVNPEDIDQIAEKMVYLIENPAEREKIAENGYRSCKERFSTDVIIPKMEEYYMEVIHGTTGF